MNRLTKRIDGRLVFPNELIGVMMTPSNDTMRQILTRLAAYEDTGMEPEEIYEVRFLIAAQRDPQKLARLRELVLAEQDGRLVVLPWAAGDVIYEADPAHGVVKHTFAEEPAWMMHSYAVDDAGNEWYDGWGSSDETPFYKTREEAEAALKGGEG